MDPANEETLRRIQSAAAEGRALTGADAAFYQHELYENELMSHGMDGLQAHMKALADLGHEQAQLYDPEVVRMHASSFNKYYFRYWGIQWPSSS